MSRNLHDLNVFGVYYRNFGQKVVRNFILEKETQTNSETFFKNFWRNRKRFLPIFMRCWNRCFLRKNSHIQHPFVDRACHVCAQDKNIFPGVFQKKVKWFLLSSRHFKAIYFAWPAVLWRRASCETWIKQFSHNFRVWTNIVLPVKLQWKVSSIFVCQRYVFLIKTSVPNWGIIRYWLTTHTYLRISTHI